MSSAPYRTVQQTRFVGALANAWAAIDLTPGMIDWMLSTEDGVAFRFSTVNTLNPLNQGTPIQANARLTNSGTVTQAQTVYAAPSGNTVFILVFNLA